jgi:hypothetical protein
VCCGRCFDGKLQLEAAQFKQTRNSAAQKLGRYIQVLTETHTCINHPQQCGRGLSPGILVEVCMQIGCHAVHMHVQVVATLLRSNNLLQKDMTFNGHKGAEWAMDVVKTAEHFDLCPLHLLNPRAQSGGTVTVAFQENPANNAKWRGGPSSTAQKVKQYKPRKKFEFTTATECRQSSKRRRIDKTGAGSATGSSSSTQMVTRLKIRS